MKLEITKERVLEAASKCSTAKQVLKTLFPEAFVEEIKLSFKTKDILVSLKQQQKSYMIAVDDNRNLRIVGLHSAYIWQDKKIKIENSNFIKTKDIEMVFAGRKISEYMLKREGKLFNVVTGQEIQHVTG